MVWLVAAQYNNNGDGEGGGPTLLCKGKTYERNNLLLDLLRQRDDLEEQ